MLLNALNVKKEYGIQTVLDIEKLEIRDGDRIGLIGRNGAGKSTLLGVLSGRIACDEGVVKRYCPIAEILQTGETEDEPEARLLSQLKLRDSAVKSGGEKTRRAIGAAFSSQAPLLFADEPTTNLDMEGVELLEKMMKGYRGAILMISHDRTLLDRVCNQIWELTRETSAFLTEITPTGPPKRNGNGASRSLNTSSTRRRKSGWRELPMHCRERARQ